MSRLPAGWRKEIRDGVELLVPFAVVALPAERVEVRVLPRVPYAPAAALLAGRLAANGMDASRAGPLERLVTDESEHAALQSALGQLGGRPARRTVAAVLLDEDAVVLEATLLLDDPAAPASVQAAAALDEALRFMLRGRVFGLGVRPRRVEHMPPTGWAVVRPDVRTVYEPSDAAAHPARLTVWPAVPEPAAPGAAAGPAPAEEDDDRPRPGEPARAVEAIAVRSLRGSREEWTHKTPDGRRELRRLAVLRDRRYVYRVALRAAVDPRLPDRRWRFALLVGSLKPVPEPIVRTPPDVDGAVSHWTR